MSWASAIISNTEVMNRVYVHTRGGITGYQLSGFADVPNNKNSVPKSPRKRCD